MLLRLFGFHLLKNFLGLFEIMRLSIAAAVAFALPVLGSFIQIPVPPAVAPHADTVFHNMTFQQHISHTDHDLGDFSQRYWYSTEFWKGPGSPVSFRFVLHDI